MSERAILSELSRVEASLVYDRGSGKRYLILSAGSSERRFFYAAVGLRQRRWTLQTLLVDSW